MGAANLCHYIYNCDLPLEEKFSCEYFRRNYYLYDYDKAVDIIKDAQIADLSGITIHPKAEN